MTARRTTILADTDLLDRVDRHARRARTTKTAVITAALEAYLAANGGPLDLPFVGVGRSAHGRLSLDARRIVGRELGARRPTGATE
jgi:predicted transcriptional regulator